MTLTRVKGTFALCQIFTKFDARQIPVKDDVKGPASLRAGSQKIGERSEPRRAWGMITPIFLLPLSFRPFRDRRACSQAKDFLTFNTGVKVSLPSLSHLLRESRVIKANFCDPSQLSQAYTSTLLDQHKSGMTSI